VETAQRMIEAPIQELATAGRLALPTKTAGQVIWGLTHGITSLRSLRPEQDWASDLESSALDALLRGVIRSGADPGKEARS